MALKLGIQKSGRLSEQSLSLIRECGIYFENSPGKLKIPAWNFPLELMNFRDDDLPGYVADGVIDAAIVGKNVIDEADEKITSVRELGFGRCRLAVAVVKDSSIVTSDDLQRKKIATSYPKTLSKFLAEKNVCAEIHHISGSVEIAPAIGLADAICDLVSSGSTLVSNGLKEIFTIKSSEAVLVCNQNLSGTAQAIFERLLVRINGVLLAKKTKYITLNIPTERISEAVDVLPGLKAPSILPLSNKNWSSMHTVVEEDNFWDLVERLKAVGAEGILVMPIEKVIL